MATPVTLDRIDPHSVYPAVLAGSHAWAAWRLTSEADDRHVELLVPADVATRRGPEIADRVADQLRTPSWDGVALEVHLNGATAVVADGTTIAVTSRTWWPDPDRMRGDVVGVDGWPLLDEPAAFRDRFETVAARGPQISDVHDLVGWVETKLVEERRFPAGRLKAALHDLRTAAPGAHAAISHIIDHARDHYVQLETDGRVAAAFTPLAPLIRGDGRPPPSHRRQ